ncbi:MAG: glycosyltransferase family 2 protein [Candidatus Humimicrobiaceae bacterium]
MAKKIDVSIIILTRNAGTLFNDVLTNVFKQDLEEYEVIVIDSSSEDNTFNIAKQFPVKIITIDPKDFGHGKTRNFGAKIAKGKFLVFLNQDAVPGNNTWLTELIKDLSNKKTAGTYGRQIARDNATPMEKLFYFKMYHDKKIIWNKNNIKNDEIIFSTANSAIRKYFLLENPFPENILMSEDMGWALTMIDKGFNILYKPLAIVNHSHDTTAINLFKRYFDFGVSHSEIDISRNKSNFVGKGFSMFMEELKYLIVKGQITWIPRAFLYYFAKFSGLMLGRNHKYIPRIVKINLSQYKSYWK